MYAGTICIFQRPIDARSGQSTQLHTMVFFCELPGVYFLWNVLVTGPISERPQINKELNLNTHVRKVGRLCKVFLYLRHCREYLTYFSMVMDINQVSPSHSWNSFPPIKSDSSLHCWLEEDNFLFFPYFRCTPLRGKKSLLLQFFTILRHSKELLS